MLKFAKLYNNKLLNNVIKLKLLKLLNKLYNVKLLYNVKSKMI